MVPSRPIAERFWEKVEKAGPGDCWLWTAFTSLGYGRIGFKGKTKLAHHVGWFLAYGAWPSYLLHSCDVRACVNPAHLREGTQQQNMDDRRDRGRTYSKLNPDQVREIRRLLLTGLSQRKIGSMFGVSQKPVTQISLGKTWRHVA